MRYIISILVLLMIIVQSCKKEEDLNIENPLFFESPREIIVKESFEFGSSSTTIDPNYTITSIGASYVQDGACATIEKGYLNIGCVEPLIPPFEGTNEWRSYRFGYTDTIWNYKSSYPLGNYTFRSSKVGIQIDYHRGGITEFQIGKFIVTSSIAPENLDDMTLHFSINIKTGEFQAYLNQQIVTNRFTIEETQGKSYEIVFRTETTVEYIAGIPYVNINGMRIDQIEVYNY